MLEQQVWFCGMVVRGEVCVQVVGMFGETSECSEWRGEERRLHHITQASHMQAHLHQPSET